MVKPRPKKLKIKDSNSTGGSLAKPNISDSEREKGKVYMEQAIKLSKLCGKSLYFQEDEQENYSDKFMHAYWKKDLDSVERTKSRYAIPMLDSVELSFNDREKAEKKILDWEDGMGIIINYQNLLVYNPTKRDRLFMRNESEMRTILINYNKLQGNC